VRPNSAANDWNYNPFASAIGELVVEEWFAAQRDHLLRLASGMEPGQGSGRWKEFVDRGLDDI